MSKQLLGVGWVCVTISIVACAAWAADEPSASDEVVLRFPPERSMGSLSILGEPPTRNRPEAQGDVRLPRGKKFGLLLSRGTTDLSCLRDMPKQGLEALYCNMLDWTDDAVAQVTTLEGLKTLYLGAPNVTDDTLAAVARMNSLEDLSISAKSVTNDGLRKLAPLDLKRLSLYGIKISDECVATIGRFKSLESLSLRNYSGNKDNVGDAGVAHLKDLSKLESLDLEGTKITDAGMASLAGLVNLKSLTLSRTAVTNDGLKHLAGIRGLTTLNIDAAGVSDAALVHIAHLTQLEGLKLGVISSDSAFEQLGKLTSLKRLEANVGNASNAAWSCLDNLVGLESLRLMGSGVDDEAVNHIVRLPVLKSLDIQNARVTDEGLSQMARLTSLEHLSLYRCPLTADGLRSLGTLKRLNWLSLGGITDMGTAGLESLALSPSIEVMNLRNDFRVATITEDQVGHLAALPKLRYLQLSSIEVTDRGAKLLSQFPTLAELSMDGGRCTLTDEGLESLAKTANLTNLSTGGTFTKQGLDALAQSKSLKHVILSTNDLPPEAVEKFRKNCYLMVFPYQPQPMITPKTRAEQYYVADRDPRVRITQALTDARLGHARVVLAIGSAKSEPGQQLATLLASDIGCREHLSGYRDVGLKGDSPAVAAMLAQNYGLSVMVDVPTLVILDETDAVVAKESFTPSESNGKVDATAVGEFLKKHALAPLDAQQVLADALSQARTENKRVYVQETGMHCAPCLAMSRFIDLNREILAGDFVFVKIDRSRYANADEAMKHVRNGRSGGIPWVAILDAEGKVLATSNGPDGQNLGFPYDSTSVEHYLKMLSVTAQRMTGEQMGELRRWFDKRRTLEQAKTN